MVFMYFERVILVKKVYDWFVIKSEFGNLLNSIKLINIYLLEKC